MCRRAIDQIGPFTFVIAHMGGWHDWQDVPTYLAGTSAFVDTSFSTGSFSPMPDGYWKEGEEKMLWMRNKWLTCHSDSPQQKNGAYVGICGENLTLKI